MEEKKEESKEEVEEKSTSQENSTDETKDNQPEEEETSQKNEDDEEQVTLTTKELEKLKKKAQDFDGIIEKQRLAKLANKEQSEKKDDDDQKPSTLSQEDIDKMIDDKLADRMRESQKEQYQQNLQVAYREFVKSNPWADDDEVINSISKKFNAGTAITSQQLLAKIDIAASEAYPTEFRKAQEDRIKSKLLTEEENINIGDTGGSSTKKKSTPSVKATAEDKRMADRFYNGDVEKYLKYKDN